MKVLILADTHYDDGSRHLHYPASKEAVNGLWQWLLAESQGYDLVAICGDITVKGTTHLNEIEYVKNMMDSLGKPYIVVPGNHDLCPVMGMEERYPDLEEYEYTELENTLFYRTFKEDGVRYSRVLNDIRFIGLAIRNDDPDGQLDWYLRELERPEKKIVICHYPITRTREDGFCSWWGYSRIDKVIDTMREMTGSPDSKVLAYFCGHQHINSIVRMNDTIHVETASTVLGPASYRILEIDDSKIALATHRLPYIKAFTGQFTLPDQSKDESHMTVEEYHLGNKDDLSYFSG
ncbi:MAG TPA: metallophosphoesterase [Clostridia bacterium]|nr:metallophosphoesterase [Clostridia bacterium]HPQ46148.1 metallophosphoesterase [Clostridia bacterium]